MADHLMTRGDSATIVLTVVDGAGAPLDLTGKTLIFTAKRAVVDPDPGVFQKRTGAGIAIRSPQSGATKGVADVAILPADTAGLPAYRTTLIYDAELVDGGAVSTLETGTLTVAPDVTLATT